MKNSTFADAMRDYENAVLTGQDTTDALQTLATSIAYSVLRKTIDVSNNPALRRLRIDVAKDTAYLQTLSNAMNSATRMTYTADGELRQEVVDPAMYAALADLCGESLGDGLDLVAEAAIAIMEETRKAQARRGAALSHEFLEVPYTVRRLKKRVLIRNADSRDGWEDEETTPVQEAYRAVRRYIANSRAVQTDPRNGYSYLEEMAADPESDALETVYRRYGKYADIGGYAVDSNHKETTYSADRQTATNINDIIALLNLTARQALVIDLRMRGYGMDAIATYVGVSNGTIHHVVSAVRKKCEKVGFTPDMWREMAK